MQSDNAWMREVVENTDGRMQEVLLRFLTNLFQESNISFDEAG